MNNKFPENEQLYRAVYPPERNRMFWKDDNHISSAVFLDKKGLSVERGNYRSDETVIQEMKKSFIGKIISVTVEQCLNINARPIYKPTKRSVFHSEIHGDKHIVLSPKQRLFLSMNCRLVDIDV